MLVFITVMWVTEALPFFVTALCVPALCVLLRLVTPL
jgi:phosphate transporter